MKKLDLFTFKEGVSIAFYNGDKFIGCVNTFCTSNIEIEIDSVDDLIFAYVSVNGLIVSTYNITHYTLEKLH